MIRIKRMPREWILYLLVSQGVAYLEYTHVLMLFQIGVESIGS